jgi:hypothetical protein
VPGPTSGWRVVSELPVSVDAQGLLDTAFGGELLILKNLYRQYRGSELTMTIRLDCKNSNAQGLMQNVIRDLDLGGVNVTASFGRDPITHPRTRLNAPGGSIAREWQGFVGPAEIGLAMREALGEPLYSQMEVQ